MAPGFVDLHAHLREPGEEGKETLLTGTEAAAAGGFTTVCCMPNTQPPIDNQGMVDFILNKVRLEGRVRVYPIAAITQGRQGKTLTEMGDLHRAGAIALSDDGDGVMNAEVMRRALEYAGMFNLPIIAHCEDRNLSLNGSMNEGRVATSLGLLGIPKASEEVQAARDVILAQTTGGILHLTHVSTGGIVDLVRRGKKAGVRVSCDVTPHHLCLTDEAVRGYDTSAKMKPPLRSQEDQDALWKGIEDGAVEAIATDHAPHSALEKEVEFSRAAFGIVGLETAFAVCHQAFCVDRKQPLDHLIRLFTAGPAKILGRPKGSLSVGSDADLVFLNPKEEWTIDKNKFFSLGRNSPFHGWKVKGRVVRTFVNGIEVYREGKITAPSRLFS